MDFSSLPGLVSYSEARELQLKLLELRIENKIPDTVLFLEHLPVITQGRGLQFTGTPRPRHMPLPISLPDSIAFVESERGGDLTYHGPGQLVIYPICLLDGKGVAPHHDLNAWIRFLESSVIRVLSECYKIQAFTQKDATGVWVNGSGGVPQKIVSLGIAIRKWVSYHGLAINVVNDMSPFQLISPCGFQSEVMTKVEDLLQGEKKERLARVWREELEQAFQSVFRGEP